MATAKSGKAFKRLRTAKSPSTEQTIQETDFDRNWSTPIVGPIAIRIIIFIILTFTIASFYYPEEANCILGEVSKVFEHSLHGTALKKISAFFKSLFAPNNDETNSEMPPERVEEVDAEEFNDNEFVEFEGGESKTDSVRKSEIQEGASQEKLESRGEHNIDEHESHPNKVKGRDDKTGYAKMSITNEEDYLIRDHLDFADNLLLKNSLEPALEAYKNILLKHPSSPRAKFGKGRCLSKLAEKMLSNSLLDESIRDLEGLVFSSSSSSSSVPNRLLFKAGSKLIELQNFRGLQSRMTKAIDHLMMKFPKEVEFLNKGGVNMLQRGNNKKAWTYFEKVLSIDPNNQFAFVHAAYILKNDNQYEEAVRYFERGMGSSNRELHHGRFYQSYGYALYRLNRVDEAFEVYRRGAEKGSYPSQWQRSTYNCEGLTSHPWWNKKQTGAEEFLTHLEDNWVTIRDEALNVMELNGRHFLLEDEGLTHYGRWTQFTLFLKGQKIIENCNLVPKTCAMIDRFKYHSSCTRGQIKFSLMNPKVHVWPHCGPTNCRIRAHLGLVVPKEDAPMIRVGAPTEKPRFWEEGKFIIFDDSFDHEAWHNGTSFRLVLIVDVWHPEVTPRQRRVLQPI